MALATITSRVDQQDKINFDAFCKEVGMNASTAINMFIKTVLREHCIPFSIGFDQPNYETLAAIHEVEEMKRHPESYPAFSSVDDLMEDLMS